MWRNNMKHKNMGVAIHTRIKIISFCFFDTVRSLVLFLFFNKMFVECFYIKNSLQAFNTIFFPPLSFSFRDFLLIIILILLYLALRANHEPEEC